MITTAVHTPQLNGLSERGHGVILSLACTVLHQAKLRLGLWNYAIRHVNDCRNFFPHSVTKEVFDEVLFDHPSSENPHFKPFGCHMMYQAPAKRLPAFRTSIRNRFCILHEGGGIYLVLTDAAIVRTKHERPWKLHPGLTDIRSVNRSTQSDDPIVIDFGLQSDSKKDDDPTRDDSTLSCVFEHIMLTKQEPHSDSNISATGQDDDGMMTPIRTVSWHNHIRTIFVPGHIGSTVTWLPPIR